MYHCWTDYNYYTDILWICFHYKFHILGQICLKYFFLCPLQCWWSISKCYFPFWKLNFSEGLSTWLPVPLRKSWAMEIYIIIDVSSNCILAFIRVLFGILCDETCYESYLVNNWNVSIFRQVLWQWIFLVVKLCIWIWKLHN